MKILRHRYSAKLCHGELKLKIVDYDELVYKTAEGWRKKELLWYLSLNLEIKTSLETVGCAATYVTNNFGNPDISGNQLFLPQNWENFLGWSVGCFKGKKMNHSDCITLRFSIFSLLNCSIQ